MRPPVNETTYNSPCVYKRHQWQRVNKSRFRN